MNNRIKELAKQATSILSVNHEGYRGKGYIEQVEYFDKEKFAELIVTECVRKIEDIAESSNTPQPIYRVAVELLEHFGVEE